MKKFLILFLPFFSYCQYSAQINFTRDTKLKKSEEKNSEIIKIYKNGFKAIALNYNPDTDIIKVNVNDTIGYVYSYWAVQDEFTLKFINDEKMKIKDEAEKKANDILKKQIEAEIALDKIYTKKFGEKIYNKIKNHKYWIGMTKEMASISLGDPKDINRTVTINKISEQWVYNGIYLYFENNILISFQD